MGSTKAISATTRIGFEWAVALLGCAAVVLGWSDLLASPAATVGELGVRETLTGAALFLSVSAGSRLFAFPLSGLMRGLPPSAALTLDAAILTAGTLTVGAPVMAAGLAIIVSVDSAVRALRTGRLADGAQARGGEIARRALYLGGAAGGLLLLCAAAFGDQLRDAEQRTWIVAAFGLAFLGAHAALELVHAAVLGDPLKPALRRALFASLAEATLLPLGAVIVQIWDPRRPFAFVALAGTYLLVNAGFYRIALITASLRGHVRELRTLTRTAQAMAAELEVPRLVAALLRECHRALPQISSLELRLRRADGGIERHAIGRAGERLRTSMVPRCAWDEAEALTVEEQAQAPVGAPQARLVAPIKMYGETLGVLVAESHRPAAFGPNELRLVSALTGQAASALENARLHALANFDGLTGLHCRRYFDTRLTEEIERARRFDTGFCVVLLDIDNFKKLNDRLGHLAGDRVLREVAQLAQAQLRNVDLAARYGGEELVFILPRTPIADAHLVAERIREAIGGHVFPDIGRVTASLGVAAYGEASAETQVIAANVLGRADIALYRAKALGKDRVEVDHGPIELSPSLAPITRRRQA